MWRRLLVFALALSLCFAPCFAASGSSPSASPSVLLSQADAAAIQAALDKAEAALKASSQEIATQSQHLKMLEIGCGVLLLALVVDSAAHLVEAIKR